MTSGYERLSPRRPDTAGQRSTVQVSTLRLPCAPIGGEDPVPPVDSLLEAPFELAEDLPEEIAHGASFGRPRSMHPYLLQNRYGRDRVETELTSVVLENEHLRAEVLPQLGGRLWSLTDTATGRELLHRNPVVQPANLALRNAWFAGGIEWNIGTKGHSPHTASPLHAALVDTPDGERLLRMWELERLRGVVYQVDLWLPPASRALWVHVRIQNPGEDAVPMYWWSNAAVPQHDDVRVLAPATRAFATSYDGRVRTVPVPVHDGTDVTWPVRSQHAADYFFDVAAASRPWVAAVDRSGHGLGQVSTRRLTGRKLFCWGTAAGGRRWQRWLSPEGGDYLEIQAGLAATQFEHLSMPAGASWSWVEAYGDVAADPERAHGEDWAAATEHVGARVEALAPADAMADALAAAEARADLAPTEPVTAGSGWGALEGALRARTGRRWVDETGTPFAPETMGPEQELWLAVLAGGDEADAALAGADPRVPPPSYVAGAAWADLLGRSRPSWARDYHLGVLAHAAGDLADAARHYEASFATTPTAWALRGLGRLAVERRQPDAAAELLARAAAEAPDEPTVLLEAVTAALDAGDGAGALALIDAAPERLRNLGRLRLLEARAAAAAGADDRLAAVLDSDLVVPDLREGETSLSDLWAGVFPDRPVPEAYDFRMR